MRCARCACNVSVMAITPKAVGDRAALIQIRARLTPDEHQALRVIAAQRGVEQAELVADALRATYPLTTEGQATK